MAKKPRNQVAVIRNYLRKRKSPLAKHAAEIVRAGKRYRVDPLLIVAIAGAETTFATNPAAGRDITSGHNAWGWGPHIQFPSWKVGINTIARGLRRGYLNEGRQTIPAIGAKWAPAHAANDPTGMNSGWAGTVSSIYRELGGSGALGKAPKGPVPKGPGLSTPKPGSRAYTRTVQVPGGARVVKGTKTVMQGDPESVSIFNTVSQMFGLPEVDPEMFAREVEVPTRQIVKTPGRTIKVKPGARRPFNKKDGTQPAQTLIPGKKGKVRIRSGADRSGVRTQPVVFQFLRSVAGIYGRPLEIGTGTNHSQMTTSGNVSEHWSGHAADIGAYGAALTKMGYSALRAAGVPRKKARAMAKAGGLFNINHRGHRIQIIFKTTIGGNHWNHLHVGIRKA